ncbi:hypothetical protein NLG97_g9632 [Lecanicillium saksenae]|uniref:Uncharacterized protein n=1 Tax=Lecanicillium saksenae TaxID=468837 RepID=A0ACC1QIG2_9HYPO|nr:hypothetical protein NLG97_g9632 [Lecanicillium saksenae]
MSSHRDPFASPPPGSHPNEHRDTMHHRDQPYQRNQPYYENYQPEAESSGSTPWPENSPRGSVDGGYGTYTPYTFRSVAYGATTPVAAPRRKFKSYRLRAEYPKPWLQDKDIKKTRWNNIIVGTWILIGFIAAGVVAYFMSKPYVQKDYCLVYEDNFEKLDTRPAYRADAHNGDN